MQDDQIEQELLKRSSLNADRIPASLATAAGQFLYSSGSAQWIVKTLAQVSSLLGIQLLVPYTGATENVDLGAYGISAAEGAFGTLTDNTTFEDGTGYQVCTGDAQGYIDIFFPHGVPKTTGTGNPTLVTYLGNLRGYLYQVNDAHDFDPQEYYHQCVVGGDVLWHLHILSRANDGTDRAVRFTLEASYAAPNGVETLLPVGDIEVVVPAGTAAPTHLAFNVMTSSIPNIGPAWMLSARLKRIAAVGTAPSVDPIVKALHAHVKLDTPQGSREAFTK